MIYIIYVFLFVCVEDFVREQLLVIVINLKQLWRLPQKINHLFRVERRMKNSYYISEESLDKNKNYVTNSL